MIADTIRRYMEAEIVVRSGQLTTGVKLLCSPGVPERWPLYQDFEDSVRRHR